MESPDNDTIHILHVEDNPADALYIEELLDDDRNFSYRVETVARLAGGLDYISRHRPDVILLDLSLPDSTGMQTFLAVKEEGPDIPVIIMSGLADEKLAVKAVSEGAQDYLVKGKVDTELLVRSIRHAIEREKLKVRLTEALNQIKILQGLLPICSHCKNIRDDKGFWHQVEEYVTRHSEAHFTHGICPACAEKYYSDFCSGNKKKQK